MKITIESTPELAHANGLPVRVWTGTTERGTPILALVTRIAAPDNAPPEELEALQRELTEPPTRVVDPSGAAIASPRSCTVCLARDRRRPARHVARDAGGLEWFECNAHDPTDNVAETVRVVLEPIEQWFRRHELPLPGGVYRGSASEREPWASIIATGELPFTVAQAADILREGLSGAVDARVAELTSECRSLRERLKDRDKPWLVKDFWALYKAAAATLNETEPSRIDDAEAALRAQLARLRPAFDACRWESGLVSPDRLTAGERFALDALHRWLHSPAGDCELTDAAQRYHEQLASESPAECKRLEAEEERAYRADDETPAAGVTRPAFDLTPAARDYYASDLRYRAPEHLSPRDRLIIEAVEADEALRAESPDEWCGPEVKP